MARHTRYLVQSDLHVSWTEEFAARQQADFAACPEAASYSDEEAEEFLMVAQSYDNTIRENRTDVGKGLRQAGISHPPELTYDPYRLGRHIFRRWGSPVFRELVIQRVIRLNVRSMTGLMRRRFTDVMAMVEDMHLAGGLAGLRVAGLGDMIGQVKAAFTPRQRAQYAAILLYGKLRMHQFITEPEPARAPTRWELQKLLRRLHLRQVQMRSLRRSLHHLRQDRKELVSRLRALNEDVPELRHLAELLESVEGDRAAAERLHAEALAEQTRQHEADMAAVRRRIEAVRAGHAATLALRDHLLGARWR